MGRSKLYQDSLYYERTVGVVKNIRTQKVYRHRKKRFDHEMTITYSTSRYGELCMSTEYYYPFRRVGINYLYGIIRNIQGKFIFHCPNLVCGEFFLVGGICIYVGVKCRRGFSVFIVLFLVALGI